MLKRLLTTLLALFAGHHAMVLLHEWSHATVAWLMGDKPTPFDIHYGDWTLIHADEDIDYAPLLGSAAPWKASFIAGAALVTNILLYMLAFQRTKIEVAHKNPVRAEFAFWFSVFNLAELYSYMPLRAFSPGGDIGHFNAGLRLSPWILLFLAAPLVAWQMVLLFRDLLPVMYKALKLEPAAARQSYGALLVAVVFGLYGAAPLFYYGIGDVRSRWSVISLLLGIIVFFMVLREAASASEA